MFNATASSFAQKISISGKNTPLMEVLNQISKQSDYDFIIVQEMRSLAKPVTVNLKDANIETALEAIFKSQPLAYSIKDKSIVISKKDKSVIEKISDYFSDINIKGRVVDENGNPLSGASIKLKGMNVATLTNSNGEFVINNAPEDGVVVISYLGFQPKEINASADLSTIVLSISTSELEVVEVIVNTGYQSISRERSAGSIAKPDMQTLQNRSSSMNVLQRLDGLVPGLTINNAPGTETYQIRGLTSINGTASPLFVVDGVVLDNNNISSINPNDVADITVLKDATAASIWGSNAANGVIVITTKKGTNTGKIKVSYDGFVNFQGRPDTDYLPVLNSSQFIQAARDIFDPVLNTFAAVSKFSPTTWKPVPAHELILYNSSLSDAEKDALLNQLASIDNKSQRNDLFYRDALLTNHNISLSGGGDKYSFYSSLAYTDNQSSTPANSNNSYKINLRQDYKFSDKVQMYLIGDLTNSLASANKAIRPTNMFLPYTLFQDENKNNLSMPWLFFSEADQVLFEGRSQLNLDYNPLDEMSRGYSKSNSLLARINTGLDVSLFKGLKFQGVYGLVKGSSKIRDFDNDESFVFRRELAQFTQPATVAGAKAKYFLPERGGIFEVNNNLQESWNIRNQLIFDQSFNGQKHQVTALFGHEIRKRVMTENGSTVWGYDEDLLTYGLVDYLALSTTGVTGPALPKGTGASKLDRKNFSASDVDVRFLSYYSNLGYTFDRKYTLNASARIDQSNLFGKDKSAQNKPVWSLGAGWLISNEDFMSNIDWLGRLNLRTTYGVTGNAPTPGSAASFDIFAAQNNAIFPGGRGFVLSTPGNKSLSWESTNTFNMGLDFSVLSRISGSVDFYNKNTTNLIGELQVNPFTGYATIEGNQGALNNKGVELSLNSLNVRNGDFSWKSMITVAYNKNEITELYSKTAVTTGSGKVDKRFLAGYGSYAVFAYKSMGLDNIGSPQIRLLDGTNTKEKNAATPEDILYMGTFQPKWVGGFGNTLEYKSLSLQVNTVFNLGYVMRRDLNRFYFGGRLVPDVGSFTTGNVHSDFADRWMKPGDEVFTNVPAYIGAKTDTREMNYYYLADNNVVDASYIKLRDITLSYSLPKSLVSSINAEGLSFRVQASNIMLWKANKYDIDPEFHSAGSGVRNMPSNQKTITIGAHLTF